MLNVMKQVAWFYRVIGTKYNIVPIKIYIKLSVEITCKNLINAFVREGKVLDKYEKGFSKNGKFYTNACHTT